MDGGAITAYTGPTRGEKKTPPLDRAVTMKRERLSEVIMDLGPLFRMHDRELWPKRNWGAIRPNWPLYMQWDQGGILQIIAVRNAASRLVGYCAEVLNMDNHYQVRMSLCDMLFIHPDYRASTGLVSPAYRLLREREKLLDDFQVERRLIRPKYVKMFAPILKRLGYEQVAVEFQKIAAPKDNGSAQA